MLLKMLKRSNVTIGDDTTEYNAKLIGKDGDSDIAVIKIDIGDKP